MEEKLLYKIKTKKYEQIVNKKYRNFKWLLYVSIIGLSLMFLSMTFMYFLSHENLHQSSFKVIPLFYVNTFVLLASSIVIIVAQGHYREDNYKQFKISLMLIFCFGVLFLIGQSIAWYKMFTTGNNFQNNSAAYLYIISGLHALHVIGGLTFLYYFIYNSWKTLKEYATSVIYFTDPVTKSQLHLFGIFWHFISVMWFYLLFFFMTVG